MKPAELRIVRAARKDVDDLVPLLDGNVSSMTSARIPRRRAPS